MKTIRRILGLGDGMLWKRCWIRDNTGEVFPAKYQRTGGSVIVKTSDGRMVEGNDDGTTSHEQIARWWPMGYDLEFTFDVARKAKFVSSLDESR